MSKKKKREVRGIYFEGNKVYTTPHPVGFRWPEGATITNCYVHDPSEFQRSLLDYLRETRVQWSLLGLQVGVVLTVTVLFFLGRLR